MAHRAVKTGAPPICLWGCHPPVPAVTLRAFLLAGIVALCGLMAPRDAYAQRSPNDWIRTGTHPTRDGALASGREVRSAVSADVDGDGLADELVVVSAPNEHEPGSEYRRIGLVLVRHRTAGWVAEFVTEREEPWTEVSWGPRLASPDGTLVVVQHSSDPPDGPGVSWSYDLMRFGAGVDRAAVHLHGLPGEELRFTNQPDGTILVATTRRRYAVLQWDGVSMAVGPWRRGAGPSVTGAVTSERMPHPRRRQRHR